MARNVARNAFVSVLLLTAALALFVYFTATGRALLDRVWGAKQSASDIALAYKVKSAFSLSRRLADYEISVKAKDGLIMLTGQVPTEIDKGLAENVAKDVPDVKGVNNQLQVQPGLKPSEASVREEMRIADLEIRADLSERLLASPGLQGQSIQANVQERTVTITGRVETPAQKIGAERFARSIPKVVNVINKLEVSNPGAVQNEGQRASEPESGNKDLTNRVLFAFFKERENFADVGAIKAASQEGNITLTGSAGSRAERALAERIARDVEGVKSVNNQLNVTAQR
ncbi:MAG: BON domain-containing protein [Blastocatellia bacterium]